MSTGLAGDGVGGSWHCLFVHGDGEEVWVCQGDAKGQNLPLDRYQLVHGEGSGAKSKEQEQEQEPEDLFFVRMVGEVDKDESSKVIHQFYRVDDFAAVHHVKKTIRLYKKLTCRLCDFRVGTVHDGNDLVDWVLGSSVAAVTHPAMHDCDLGQLIAGLADFKKLERIHINYKERVLCEFFDLIPLDSLFSKLACRLCSYSTIQIVPKSYYLQHTDAQEHMIEEHHDYLTDLTAGDWAHPKMEGDKSDEGSNKMEEDKSDTSGSLIGDDNLTSLNMRKRNGHALSEEQLGQIYKLVPLPPCPGKKKVAVTCRLCGGRKMDIIPKDSRLQDCMVATEHIVAEHQDVWSNFIGGNKRIQTKLEEDIHDGKKAKTLTSKLPGYVDKDINVPESFTEDELLDIYDLVPVACQKRFRVVCRLCGFAVDSILKNSLLQDCPTTHLHASFHDGFLLDPPTGKHGCFPSYEDKDVYLSEYQLLQIYDLVPVDGPVIMLEDKKPAKWFTVVCKLCAYNVGGIKEGAACLQNCSVPQTHASVHRHSLFDLPRGIVPTDYYYSERELRRIYSVITSSFSHRRSGQDAKPKVYRHKVFCKVCKEKLSTTHTYPRLEYDWVLQKHAKLHSDYLPMDSELEVPESPEKDPELDHELKHEIGHIDYICGDDHPPLEEGIVKVCRKCFLENCSSGMYLPDKRECYFCHENDSHWPWDCPTGKWDSERPVPCNIPFWKPEK